MIDDERDLDAPWQPRIFRVGDKVQVRLSPECREMVGAGDGLTAPRMLVNHFPEEDGQRGTVGVPPPGFDVVNGHRIWVMFDQPVHIMDGRYLLCGSCYATVELEPLEETVDPV